MSFAAERKIIEKTFLNEWKASNSTIPVLFENTNQKIPATDFLYVRIVGSDGRQAEIAGQGATLVRYVGIVQIDIMSKTESGLGPSKELGDAAASIFRRKQLIDAEAGIITFKIPSIRPMGTSDGRYRTVITCPYTRDVRE